MKARVKATGEIVEFSEFMYLSKDGKKIYLKPEDLEFLDLPNNEPDYWEKLKHQYAGMAMQQMVNIVNVGYEYVYEETAIIALNFATALVNRLKEDKS